MAYICRVGNLFFEWSNVTESPKSSAMTYDEFKNYYKEQYGCHAMGELDNRMARVMKYGTSSHFAESVEDIIFGNMAGLNNSELNVKEIMNLVIGYRQTTGLPPLNLNA